MRRPGLILAFLALYCTVSQAAVDSTFDAASSKLNIPFAHYDHKMYDVDMDFQAPDLLILDTATEIEHDMSQEGLVDVGADLSFHLAGIEFDGKLYQADIVPLGGGQFRVTNFDEAEMVDPGDGGHGMHEHVITHLGPADAVNFSYAYGISNSGEWIVGRARNNFATRGPTAAARFFPDAGTIEPMGTLGGGSAQARDVNDDGLAAGYSSIMVEQGETAVNHAFIHVYKTGYMMDLGALGDGKDSRAYGINIDGNAVGWSASNAENSDHVAFMYDYAEKSMMSLGSDLLGGERSFAFDINDAGQVVGVATTAEGAANAFMLSEGVATNLGSLDDSGYSEARAINENGQVTGWSLDAEKNYTAYIYDEDNGMQPLAGLGGDSKGYDINIHGHVVGDALDADGGRHAFLYKDGMMYDLYDMLPEEDQANWKELREAFSINDEGVIVGRGRYWTNKEEGRNSSRAFRIILPSAEMDMAN